MSHKDEYAIHNLRAQLLGELEDMRVALKRRDDPCCASEKAHLVVIRATRLLMEVVRQEKLRADPPVPEGE